MANVDKTEVLSEETQEKQVDVIVQSEKASEPKKETADPVFYKYLGEESKYYPRGWR